MPYENYIRLAERLNDKVPGKGRRRRSSSPPAPRPARTRSRSPASPPGRDAVIAFGGGFHGRTFMGMALTGKVEPYKKGFGR
jgi:4-aminobutyrate aminotransferase